MPSNQRLPTKTNESSDDVLDSVKSLFKEAKVDISESVIDRAHRIGSRYLDASSNNYCKSIIIRFTIFRHRTMFCRAKNMLMRGVRKKLDLTKSRYDLLKRANDHVKEVPSIKFCYVDVNYRLKVKLVKWWKPERHFLLLFRWSSGYCGHGDLVKHDVFTTLPGIEDLVFHEVWYKIIIKRLLLQLSCLNHFSV